MSIFRGKLAGWLFKGSSTPAENSLWSFNNTSKTWDIRSLLTAIAHAMTSAGHTAGNWKVFHSNGSGAVAELALGADNTVLKSTVASTAPEFAAVAESEVTFTDITTNDVSTTKHGFTPKAPNDTTKFLRGDATWAVPTGGSSQEWINPFPGLGASGGSIGDFPTIILSDGGTNTTHFNGYFSSTPTSILLVFITDGGTNGQDIVWTTTTDFAAAGEAYNTNSDGETTQVLDIPTTQVVQTLELINSFTGAVAGDYFGLKFNRIGADASDTLTAGMRVLGLRVIY